ncbi:MAG: hypothetical protein IPI67_08395 [Myxococcales bacterium]|nr:hypothetical protein [Myxococcales bacterium]
MGRVDVVVLGAAIVVMGCATARNEEPQPSSPSGVSRRASEKTPAPRVHTLSVDGRMPAQRLGAALADRARELGVQGPVAFVWGDLTPPPQGARAAEIRADGIVLRGFLVPEAHEVDMGQLASEIHNVVMVGCDRRGLYAGHPSGPGRHPIDFSLESADTRRDGREIFAFVSILPGDLDEGVSSGQIVAELQKLPTRVRYAVMALSG